MKKFIIKRLIQAIVVFFVVSIIIFIMVRLSGMNELAAILNGKKATPQIIESIKERYNLNKPLLTQYFIWISGVLRGDMGTSYKYLQPVSTLLGGRLLITFALIFISIGIMLVLSITAGIASAVKKNTWIDRLISVCSLVLLSSPAFFTGIIIILLISTIAPSVSFSGTFSSIGDAVQRLFFPSFTLALSITAIVARITRSNMITQLQSNFAVNAVAKGLPSFRINVRHAFKNAVIPVITIVGIQIGALMSGTVLVESVFALPGIGSLLVEGIEAHDYPVVEALTLIFVAVFLVINIVVDILYAVIDPRIRLE